MKLAPMEIYQEFMNDIDYKTAMGFASKWPELTRFIEGKQWPAATEATKHMPRPVINVCDQTLENKRSNILSQQLTMQFRLQEMTGEESQEEIVAQDFTDMAKNTWYDLDQDTLIEEAVDDAIAIGNGIVHYYYDSEYSGGSNVKYMGRIQGELIDPMDICFGNNRLKPYQTQKQPFMILRRNRGFDEVVGQAKKTGEDADKIQPDKSNDDVNEKYDSGRVESKNDNTVTTYMKYYKDKKEVWYTEVTKNATVIKPKRLAPVIDNDGIEEYEPFKLYPVVHLGFKRRRKSVYYRSLIEDIIPNQKALNWGMGMQLLSMQQAAWPKIIAKVGALTQQITNTPGEVLEDNYKGGGDGFKYMQVPSVPASAANLTNTILDMTRNIIGVTEVSTGETIGANMAASAIIALQNQAQKPNEGYMKNVVSFVKRGGEIWEQFYKSYYNQPIPIKGQDEKGKEIGKVFYGERGRGIGFDLIIDVGPASTFTESLQVSILDNYADRQWIDKYTHAKNMPNSVLPQDIREQFKKEEEQAELLEEQTNAVMAQLTPQEKQMLQQQPELMDGLI